MMTQGAIPQIIDASDKGLLLLLLSSIVTSPNWVFKTTPLFTKGALISHH